MLAKLFFLLFQEPLPRREGHLRQTLRRTYYIWCVFSCSIQCSHFGRISRRQKNAKGWKSWGIPLLKRGYLILRNKHMTERKTFFEFRTKKRCASFCTLFPLICKKKTPKHLSRFNLLFNPYTRLFSANLSRKETWRIVPAAGNNSLWFFIFHTYAQACIVYRLSSGRIVYQVLIEEKT